MSVLRSARIIAALVVGALLSLAVAVPAAFAAPATVRALDLGAPSLGQSITISAPGGGTFSADPGRALVRLTPAGGTTTEVLAWCVDATRSIGEGVDYAVDLQTVADSPELSTPAYRQAGWLIGASDQLIAVAPDAGFEAAAIQVAVWQLVGDAADVPAVTANPALNARVAQLRALSTGRTLVSALALTGPSGTVTAGSPTTLTVTGTPGAVVDLAVTLGSGVLPTTQVTLGESGTAQVALTPSAAGTVAVSASAQGGRLDRFVHLSGRRAPQDMALVTPVTLRATATVTAVAPAVTSVVTPSSPPVLVAPAVTARVRASLHLVKTAPAKVRRPRTIGYTLTVTNTSAVRATDVVVRDPVPAGTFVPNLPANARLVSGAVVWRLGNLAPGASVTVSLRLGTRTSPLGQVVNVGSASAGNAARVTARAATLLIAPLRVAPARVQPAVTG